MHSPRALVLVASLVLACASIPPQDTAEPVEWAKVASEEVPQIVTVDEDGEVRETKLWVVVVDGTGYLRTSGTRWLANIDRDPNVVLRIGGAAHKLRADPVVDPELEKRILAAFRAKYGFSDRMTQFFVPGRPTLLRLSERTGVYTP